MFFEDSYFFSFQKLSWWSLWAANDHLESLRIVIRLKCDCYVALRGNLNEENFFCEITIFLFPSFPITFEKFRLIGRNSKTIKMMFFYYLYSLKMINCFLNLIYSSSFVAALKILFFLIIFVYLFTFILMLKLILFCSFFIFNLFNL